MTFIAFWHAANFVRRNARLPELNFSEARCLYARWLEQSGADRAR